MSCCSICMAFTFLINKSFYITSASNCELGLQLINTRAHCAVLKRGWEGQERSLLMHEDVACVLKSNLMWKGKVSSTVGDVEWIMSSGVWWKLDRSRCDSDSEGEIGWSFECFFIGQVYAGQNVFELMIHWRNFKSSTENSNFLQFITSKMDKNSLNEFSFAVFWLLMSLKVIW